MAICRLIAVIRLSGTEYLVQNVVVLSQVISSLRIGGHIHDH